MYVYTLPNAAGCKITATATATSLLDLISTAASIAHTLPGDLNAFDIMVESNDCRILMDGNTPTATNGFLLKAGALYNFRNVPVNKVKLIRVSSDSVCSVQLGKSTFDEVSSSSMVNLAVGDIEIGAVEIKDGTSDNRATVDSSGRVRVFNESGSSTLPATHVSPTDGAAVYTSNVSVTCSGFPYTVDDTNCSISYIMYKPTAGVWTRLMNGTNGVSITSASNVVTVAGAGTPFASGDSYRVGIQFQDKAYQLATDSKRMQEINPLSLQVIEETLVDTTNVASGTVYYPSSAGMAMLGFADLSLTGKLIDADATLSMTVEITNDEDTTNADWVQIYGYDTKNNTVVNSISAASGTTTFSWNFDNLNYKYVRVKIVPTDSTNTVIIKARRKAV